MIKLTWCYSASSCWVAGVSNRTSAAWMMRYYFALGSRMAGAIARIYAEAVNASCTERAVRICGALRGATSLRCTGVTRKTCTFHTVPDHLAGCVGSTWVGIAQIFWFGHWIIKNSVHIFSSKIYQNIIDIHGTLKTFDYLRQRRPLFVIESQPFCAN